MRESLWGVEAYKLSAEFVHIVGSLLVPTCFLLWNILSRISGTAFILMFCGVRGFYQFHTLPLLQSDLVEDWGNSVHVLEFPYRMIGGKHGKYCVSSRSVGVRVYMPQRR